MSTIMKYDDWLLEGALLEKLNFASGFVDPAPLRILTKMWENYSKLEELELSYFGGPQKGWGSELGRIETSDRKISVYIDEDTSPAAIVVRLDSLRDNTITAPFIVLANGAPASRMKTSVLFHEVLHILYPIPETEPDSNLRTIFYKDKNSRLHLPKKALKTSRLENASYWYTSDEFSSYIGQLYLAVWGLLSDSAKAAKVNGLLRAGKISEIFQMLPEDYQERLIYQLYFGGGDEVAIKELKKIIENRPKGQGADLDMDFVRKGLISFLPGSRRDKIIKKFKSSLHSVISGEIKILKTEVSIYENLYNLIEIAGLLPKYPNLKKIERLEKPRDSMTSPSYLTSFLTPIEIAIMTTVEKKDTEKRIKEMPNHAWTRSEILEWIKKYTEACAPAEREARKDGLPLPLEYLYVLFCQQSTENLIKRYKGEYDAKEESKKNRLELENFSNLPVPQQQAVATDLLVKRFQEDLDVIKKIFG